MISVTFLILVCFLPQPRDMEIARLLGWYRIPLKFAPKVVSMDYLVFYQPASFGERSPHDHPALRHGDDDSHPTRALAGDLVPQPLPAGLLCGWRRPGRLSGFPAHRGGGATGRGHSRIAGLPAQAGRSGLPGVGFGNIS